MGNVMKLETTKFSVADYIDTAEDVLHYIDAALEDNDPVAFRRHLAAIAKSKGMADLAAKAKISRAGIYKAFDERSDPQMSTMFSIIGAMGYRFSIKPASEEDQAAIA